MRAPTFVVYMDETARKLNCTRNLCKPHAYITHSTEQQEEHHKPQASELCKFGMRLSVHTTKC